MKKQYTRKQIQEAINYWEKQLETGNYRKTNESIDTAKINPNRWYVVNNCTAVDNADEETQQRVFDGELDFDDAAVTEMFIDGCCPDGGFATLEEANAAAFEEWGDYSEYDSYKDWVNQEWEFPNAEHRFVINAGNGDSNPMDRFESDIEVMKGSKLITNYLRNTKK